MLQSEFYFHGDSTTTEDSIARPRWTSFTTSIGYCIEGGRLLVAMNTVALVVGYAKMEKDICI